MDAVPPEVLFRDRRQPAQSESIYMYMYLYICVCIYISETPLEGEYRSLHKRERAYLPVGLIPIVQPITIISRTSTHVPVARSSGTPASRSHALVIHRDALLGVVE